MTVAEQQAIRSPGGRGVWAWITTVDHKRIGVMYGVSAFFFFLVGGIEALLIRLQLGSPENTLIDPDLYNQLFTMHGTTMVFLAIMPLSAAFFNFIVPLQIGARDVAFPRLNAFSFWVFFLGALFMNASFLFGGAPDAGWFGYANLTSTQYSPGMRVDFWVIGLLVLGVSSIAAALNFIVTIINLRCEGMTLMRMPLFTWMTLITSFLLVMAFPAITVGLVSRDYAIETYGLSEEERWAVIDYIKTFAVEFEDPDLDPIKTGKVVELRVAEGDEVREGEVLLKPRKVVGVSLFL